MLQHSFETYNHYYLNLHIIISIFGETHLNKQILIRECPPKKQGISTISILTLMH